MTHFLPEASRWLSERVLISVNLRPFPNEIHLDRSDIASSLGHFPSNKQNNSQNLHRVILEEYFSAPWPESIIPICQDDNSLYEQGDICTVWLKISVIRSCLSVDSLSHTCLVVVDESDRNDEKVDESSTRDYADKPVQNLGGAIRALEKAEEREKHGNTEAPDGNSPRVAVSEKPRGTSCKG